MANYPFKIRGTNGSVQDVRNFLMEITNTPVAIATEYDPGRPNDLAGEFSSDDASAVLNLWTEATRFRGLTSMEIKGLDEPVESAP